MKKIILLVLVTIFVFTSTAMAADTYKIKLGQTVSEKDLNYIAVRDVFKKYVEETSKGRIEVELYPNNQLGAERQMIEGLTLGTIEMGVLSPGVVAGFVPTWQVFDLPFIFKSREVAYKALDGELGDRLKADSLKKGIMTLVFPENGIRQLTNNKRPIKSPNDLKGMKIRVMENPVHVATFKALGANPTPMNFGELYTALSQKTVDGQDNPVTVTYSSKFNEVQKYMSLIGHVYAPSSMLISAVYFNKLPKDIQTIIVEGANRYKVAERKSISDNEGKLLAEMEKKGLIVNKLSAEEQQVFIDKTKGVYDQFKDKIGADIIKLAQSYNK